MNQVLRWRDGRVAEGARLESVYTLTGIVGSNPTLSAIQDQLISFGLRVKMQATPQRTD